MNGWRVDSLKWKVDGGGTGKLMKLRFLSGFEGYCTQLKSTDALSFRYTIPALYNYTLCYYQHHTVSSIPKKPIKQTNKEILNNQQTLKAYTTNKPCMFPKALITCTGSFD